MSLQSDLSGTTDYTMPQRVRIVQALAAFRKEWQIVAQGKSLLDIEAPVGLILSDIAEYLELGPQERHVMLGAKLINQVNALMEESVNVILPS